MHRPFKKPKTSARRDAEDVDSGASGSMMTSPTEINFGGSSSSPSEANNRASSSSTASLGNCYEVFLSFRGPDTRDGFTSHLHKGLLNAGIHVFRDDDELFQGKSIGPELMAAIANSKILIPILSETHGESSWCLDELVRIMECEKNNEQMVLPIFYKVKPADVGHQIGSFGEAFRERERRLLERPSFDQTMLENWKKALAEVSKLKGYEAIGDEAELVELIVQKVLSELKKNFDLVNSENLVGIDSLVTEIMEFVNEKSHVTLFVGIYGMGGIGKTTLAKAIYNKLSNQFEHPSFIADIRESWERNHIHYLQNKLIHDILKRENEVYDRYTGTNFISSRFKAKKVLVLLDDVDDVAQLNCLAGNRNWFSSGSIIIITTRDERILEEVGVDYPYDHKELNKAQSLILFSKHAFRENSHPGEFKNLTCEVVSIIGGLPLSLEVLGSLLCGRDLAFWRDTIKKLKKAPPKEVQERLRISYEALDYEQQQIFLDIACFFIGTHKKIACYMWDACRFFPEEGIEILRLKSLIKIGGNHELRMHDQLRDLGREIVREKNQREPWYHSRLWQFEEVQEVLKGNKGTDKIEAISLSKGSSEGSNKVDKRHGDIYTEKQFKNLTHLRFLNLEGAYLRGDFEDSMEELKWLQWSNCPMNFEVKNLHVKELVSLELLSSAIDEKWEGWSSFMMAKKLKFLDLSYCNYLENTDFLSAFKNLEVLILNDCEGLQRINSSIGDMKALFRLELCGCRRLMELPTEIGKLNALKLLLLEDTSALSALPDSIGSLENLEILQISFSGIKELPDSIGRLRKLRELMVVSCENLRGEMPESVSNLSSLRRLDFLWCSKLQSLSDLPSSLTNLGVTCQSHELPSPSHLKELRVYCCRFLKCIQALPSGLPESLDTPFKLETLEVFGCDSIETLDVSQFMNLRTLSAQCCSILLEVQGLDKLIYLENLTFEFCGFKRLDLPKLEYLKRLDVWHCDDLVDIQGLDILEFLESLKISSCTSIERLLLPKSKSLMRLDAGDCKNLVEIQGLDRPELLESLDISGCTSIERLLLPKSGSLKILCAKSCKRLAEIQGLDRLDFLVWLDISECTLIERLLLPKSESLKKLDAEGCENLARIQGLDRLEFLESFNISRCPSIERLLLPKARSLKSLYVASCKKLTEIRGLDRLEFLEKLEISECTSIERLLLPKSESLKNLDAQGCENLVEIQGLDRLEFLESLNIYRCTSIERLLIPKSGSMNILDARDCKNLVEIHGLDRLEFLESLDISGCTSIERLLLPKSESLKKLDVGGCKNLAKIQGLDRLEFLESLNISRCPSIERLLLPKAGSLKSLYVASCKKLTEIRGLDRSEFLEKLEIFECTSIERLLLPKSESLKNLDAQGCENLVEIQGLDRLEFLESLNIYRCTSIKRLLIPKSVSMKKLDAGDCKNLVEIQGLDSSEFLESLDISGCTSMERLLLPKSESLKIIYAESCKKLAEIQGLNRLEFLKWLHIEGCTSIERLDFSKSGRLKALYAGSCKKLADIQGLDRLEFLEILDIEGCTSIERLYLPKSGRLEKFKR